jgi:hypothetical protein
MFVDPGALCVYAARLVTGVPLAVLAPHHHTVVCERLLVSERKTSSS